MYHRLLVATDGSTLSKKAVRGAIGLAAALGAELVVLNVVPRYPMSYFEGGASVADEEVGRIEQQWADSGQAIVDAAQKTAQAQGVKAKAVTMQSDLIAASIMAAAKNTGATSSSWPPMGAKASSVFCWAARHSKCSRTVPFRCWFYVDTFTSELLVKLASRG
jgi:nucleotide-binding universal stress UspA family protein